MTKKRYNNNQIKQFHKEELDAIYDCSSQKIRIQKQLNCGIIDAVDAANEITLINAKENKLKTRLVLEVHKTKDGRPRKIEYQEYKGLYCTLMPDKTKVYGKTMEVLIEKLFDLYGLSLTDLSMEKVFEAALAEKEATENNNPETISKYRSDFIRFIDSDLAAEDIRKIDGTKLKKHTQSLVNREHPKKKAYYSYKGVLNLTFKYAHQQGYIITNPVPLINNKCYYKSCNTDFASPEDKIFSPEEIALVQTTVREYMPHSRYKGYFINGYAMLFSIETGARAGEIPALKWSDVYDNYIHIHAQQLYRKKKGGKEYYYVTWTKDEKTGSKGGRQFPLTAKIRSLLKEIKTLQDRLGIKSEYIFCNRNGDWIKSDAYETCLRRLCRHLGFIVTNNHAFRMSLNSNVLIPLGIPVTERARMLGHSVETNLRYYSFAGKSNIDDLCSILDGGATKRHEVPPKSHHNLIYFPTKKSRNA